MYRSHLQIWFTVPCYHPNLTTPSNQTKAGRSLGPRWCDLLLCWISLIVCAVTPTALCIPNYRHAIKNYGFTYTNYIISYKYKVIIVRISCAMFVVCECAAWVQVVGPPESVFCESQWEGRTAGEVWGDHHPVREGWGAHHIPGRWAGKNLYGITGTLLSSSTIITCTPDARHLWGIAYITNISTHTHRSAGKRHYTPSTPSWQPWPVTPSWLPPALCMPVHSPLPTGSHYWLSGDTFVRRTSFPWIPTSQLKNHWWSLKRYCG